MTELTERVEVLMRALNEALDGGLRMTQRDWGTVKTTIDLRVVAERLVLRGVVVDLDELRWPAGESPND